MKNYFILLLGLVLVLSCTDLEPEIRDTITVEQNGDLIDVGNLLTAQYEALRLPYMDQSRFWAAQQHTSDETIGPTRGPDWDDNGIWRSLHDHSWSPDHDFLASTFSELLQVVFGTTNILQFEPSAEQEAQARFLRAFVMASVLDGWGQVPFREAGAPLLEDATVLGPQEAIDFIVSELAEISANLPDGPAHIANKDAALVLEMKLLLNRGAYLNRTAPTFDAGDMNRVAAIAQQLTNSGRYSISTNYFDNFAPTNDAISTENIFTGLNEGGISSGNIRSRWFCTLHYNQNPSGWNGFSTLGDFYASFEDDDVRRATDYPGSTEVAGINAGFLIGQQFDQDGNALQDRLGNPLIFTPEVALQESGSSLEVTGVRVIKYPIDYNNGDNVDNDYVFYRYADVLLMQAEALMRTGDNAGALAIVNDIRAARGASALGSIDEATMLAERGRELYWEGHRRQDLIRFGRFTDAWEQKPATGDERLLFPIPSRSLAGNPNLVQNPGY